MAQNRARTVAEVEELERLMDQTSSAAVAEATRGPNPVRVIRGVAYEVVWP